MAEIEKPAKSEAALREERILEFWRENKTFEKSLEKKSPKGQYVFYDGPPFATGQIHYGHILGSTAKDVIGRYQTMQGYYVSRKWGWDCHGLPIENIVEKELSIAGHKEIEKYGIDKFVEYARSKVLQYDKDWEKGIERIGRWVDFKGGYKTMDNTFIESVWWALSELNKKNLIYEGVRVLAYCPRCETPIANSEIAMDNSYKDISDISVYVKFELVDESGTFLLAWTTTPWTLPGNTAIAINKDIVYVKIKVAEDVLILAKETIQSVLKEKEYSILGEIKGEVLIGKKYKPVFSYYKNSEVAKSENIWKVWDAKFVTADQGTGIAHEAPAFGEDDMNLAKQQNIPWIIHVDETGRFKSEVVDFANMQVKPKGIEKDDHQKADVEVIRYLAKNNLLFAKEKIIHSYPHCMRCETPIIYYALPSWFINIQEVKEKILSKSKSINWIPTHLKEGRFKNIAENAPDWNISRNRYWASPLPIWKCEKCKEKTFINSLDNLKEKTKKSGNKYFVMRHGESENNAKNIYSSNQNTNHLTDLGKNQVLNTAEVIKDKKISKIFCSPFIRTRETASIIAEEIGFPKENIIYDPRIRELEFGEFSEKPLSEYWNYVETASPEFNTKIPGGESYQDAKNRIGDFLYEVDNKYKDENILLVSHGLAVEVIPGIIEGADKKRSLEIFSEHVKDKPASLHKEHDFIQLPHNQNYELDLHRPYIDEVKLFCDCGGDLMRIPEVLDCWFESGSMPFAQDHFPFENKNWQKNNFPAGFVAEYIAQTRTWFYYTHVVSTILFNQAPFKNIVTTGTLRAGDGEKMSKSKQNYPDPWIFIDKYGADALRIYLMSSTLMKGEDSNFREEAVHEIASKIIGRLFNVFAFYELYRDKSLEKNHHPKSDNILDIWILSRFSTTLKEITAGMEMYDMTEATRPIESFIDDLSTWYLRRSRDRIKDGDKDAKATLYYVLKTFTRLLAPFAPFSAEDIWQKLKNENDEDSVHLAEWPKESFKLFAFKDKKVIEDMEKVRNIVTLGLESRQKAGIKVRQPLAKLEVKNIALGDELAELIKDEINVKEIVENKNLEGEVLLDVKIDDELKREGDYRELARALQDMRKKIGLTPSDVITLTFETNETGKQLIQKFEADMKKTVLAKELKFSSNDGEEIKIDELDFKVKIEQ
jgi:isoleucyl-tRNA synthetase